VEDVALDRDVIDALGVTVLDKSLENSAIFGMTNCAAPMDVSCVRDPHS
jgi:hypothetical protein